MDLMMTWPTAAMQYVDGVEDESWKNWNSRLRRGVDCPAGLSINACIDDLIMQQTEKYSSINRTRKIILKDKMPDYPFVSFLDADKAYRKRTARSKTTLLTVISQHGYSLNDGLKISPSKP